MKRRKTLAAWYRRSGAFKWANRPRFTEEQFDPYVRAIGRVLLAWNDLHERLSALFVLTMGGGWVDRPVAIWHSVRTDLGKRNLLRAALEKLPESDKAGRPKLIEEITWILDAANKLEGFRDDSAHTPLRASQIGTLNMFGLPDLLNLDNLFIASGLMVFPDTAFQNPRALRLDQSDKDMLIEYRYARERILVLRDYVIAIDAAWSNARLPWPDRPDLPERRPRKAGRPRERKGE